MREKARNRVGFCHHVPIRTNGRTDSNTPYKKRPAARAVGRFVFLMESPSLNPGCHFDNQLYLILGAFQDDVDDSVDVGDVDFAIAVHVCRIGATISVQDDADDGIYICNIDLKVAVHVTNE